MSLRAASERGWMSAGKGLGKLDSPEVYSPLGVISWPSRPRALRMSIVAESDAMAIQTLRIPRKRPGQALKDKRRLEGQCEDGEQKGTVRRREVLPATEPKGRMRELLRAAVGAREEAFGFELFRIVELALIPYHASNTMILVRDTEIV